MVLDFIDRYPLQRPDDYVVKLVNANIDKMGYLVDRLKPINRERFGNHCWKYFVPVMQVTR